MYIQLAYEDLQAGVPVCDAGIARMGELETLLCFMCCFLPAHVINYAKVNEHSFPVPSLNALC